MTDVTLELADVERLAGALDAMELDDKNQQPCTPSCPGGPGKVWESEADVTGFVDEASPRVLDADLLGSFQWGFGRVGREQLNPRTLTSIRRARR